MALTIALVALWAPRVIRSGRAPYYWVLPFAVSVVAALDCRIIDARGLAALAVLALACIVSRAPYARSLKIAAHVVMLATSAALLLHVVPGFNNPIVIDRVVLGPGAEPYSKYLNFDKGVVGLFLLGIYAPERPALDEGPQHIGGVVWRFAVLVAVVMALTLAGGYVRWDPKLPPWWPMWLWSMVFLTALPEEAIFRGVAQSWIARRLGGTPRAAIAAALIVGVLFGVAHLAGGLSYVVLAAAAGIGYGWIYARTRSIGAAIAVHTGLNAVHFFFFTYPSLAA